MKEGNDIWRDQKEDYMIDFVRIDKLISKYKHIKQYWKITNYKEESIQRDFILLLYKALLWDIYKRVKSKFYMQCDDLIC